MIASMTGFARQESEGPAGQLICEIRSVNHRFLEASLRLPDNCRALESELRQALARSLRRGKVDCTLHLRTVQAAAANLDIDPVALERLLGTVRQIGQALPEQTRLDALDVLRWPGVLRDTEADAEALYAAVRSLFESTVAELAKARLREGERLAQILEQRCAGLVALVAQVSARLPEVQARVRSRLETRLAELGAEINQDRLEQEIVLLLQRLDVAEELDRLGGHLEEARHLLAGEEPAGRRLDFLLQEFNREANTLASKSQDLETTRAAMEMKVLIEQMREQVQNIE